MTHLGGVEGDVRVGGVGGGVDEFVGEGDDLSVPVEEGFAGVEGWGEVFFVLGVGVSAGFDVSWFSRGESHGFSGTAG